MSASVYLPLSALFCFFFLELSVIKSDRVSAKWGTIPVYILFCLFLVLKVLGSNACARACRVTVEAIKRDRKIAQ